MFKIRFRVREALFTTTQHRVAHKKPLGKGIIYFSLNQHGLKTILITP